LPVVWHDPSAIQREVWVGTVVVIASVLFTVLVLYSAMATSGWVRKHRLLLVLGAWAILFAVQLAYVATSETVFYGVYYDETTGEYTYYTAVNPMVVPVAAITVATAVVMVAFVLYIVLVDWGRRLGRELTRWLEE